MIFSNQLKSWLTKFRQYKVTYKSGFFHLSNLANSPYTIVETFDSVPFCKHNREEKLITAKTFFLNAQLYYSELETGLWLLLSDLQFKKNVEMTNIYDRSLPVDFNFVNLHYNETRFKNKSMLVNGKVLINKTWTLFKPGNATADCHFKGTQEYNITVYFTNAWMDKYFALKTDFKVSNMDRFFRSNNSNVIMPDAKQSSDRFYADFLSLMKQNNGDSKNKEIKELVSTFFKEFIKMYELETINDQHFRLSDSSRKYVQKAEKCMMDNLLQPFPGIEKVAKTVGISATKLKSEFKIIHNQSVYHYYRSQQMQLASKLLSEKASTVKEVANLLGYEHAGKFAAVFKEQFGIQPSELIKNNKP
jgi:AraC-like DNA-binding protein